MSASIETYHLDGLERMMRAAKIESITLYYSDVPNAGVQVRYFGEHSKYFPSLQAVFAHLYKEE